MKIRRAILIYSTTIVAPCLVLMWLGMRSFERQRQALATLEAEKLSQETERALQAAADAALKHPPHPAAKYYFSMEQGAVTTPALHAAPPTAEPAEFLAAEGVESLHPDLALAAYRKLFAAHDNESLALSRIARVLTELGRDSEAKAAWRTLATRKSPSKLLRRICAPGKAGMCSRCPSPAGSLFTSVRMAAP